MVPVRSRTGDRLSPFLSEQATHCRKPKTNPRHNVYLGIYLCFLNCRKKKITLHEQNHFLFNNKSKHDRTQEFTLNNWNKSWKYFDLCKKLHQASTDDGIISHLNSLQQCSMMGKKNNSSCTKEAFMLLWPEYVQKVTFRNCLRKHYMSPQRLG